MGYIANIEILDAKKLEERVTDKMKTFSKRAICDLKSLDVRDYENDLELILRKRTLFNVRFKPSGVHIVDLALNKREIELPRGWYRFNLYDLSQKHKDSEQKMKLRHRITTLCSKNLANK
jgi:hypothetical protein